jgi:hypothetical protein
MKIACFLAALLVTTALPARSQIIGIFEQGAEELRENGQQIAALELLLTGQRKGYQIIESGLSSIGSITGSEFTLHQNYYAGLDTVNPAIAQTGEIAECLSIESSTITALSTATQKWRYSKYLTANDHAYIQRMTAVLTDAASVQLTCLTILLTNDTLTMTDNERLQQIVNVGQQLASISGVGKSFISFTDALILNRTY